MQLIVLGMRSIGTQAVTRLLNMMGAYFGPEGLIICPDIADPKESWERKDLRDLCENTLMSVDAGLYRIADFSVEKLSDDIKAQFFKSIRTLFLELDAHRPWVINEPRLNLLFPLLRELLEVPVCIHVDNSPVKIAQYLQYYNGFPIKFGMALWEKYTISSLSATSGLPRIWLSAEEIMSDPLSSVKQLYDDLCNFEVQGLRLPGEKEVKAFFNHKFENPDIGTSVDDSFMNIRQRELIRFLESKELEQSKDIPSLSLEASEVMFQFEDKERLENNIKEKYEENLKQKDALNIKEKELAEKSEEIKKYLSVLNSESQQLNKIREQIDNLKSEIQDRDSSINTKVIELNSLAIELEDARVNLKESRKEVERLKIEIQDIRSHLTLKERELLSVSKEKNSLASETESRQREALELRTKIRELDASVHSQRENLKKSEESLQKYGYSVYTLTRWIEKLENDFSDLVKSKRWQVGNALIRMVELLLFRRKVSTAIDHISEVFKEFHGWKKTGEKKLEAIKKNS